MLWIVDGGMPALPVVARVEDWQEGEFIDVTTGSDGNEWNKSPTRYFVRGECHDLADTHGYGDKTRFECSACGYDYSSVGGFGCDYGDEPYFDYCPNCGRKVVDE